MARGGKRVGQGRPKGSLTKNKQDIRDLIQKTVDFKSLIGKLVELTEGVQVQERIGREDVIYTKAPNTDAAKILLEYGFGRPAQQIALTGGDGASLFGGVQFSIINATNGKHKAAVASEAGTNGNGENGHN